MSVTTANPIAPRIAAKVKPGTVQRVCNCGGTCDKCREHDHEKPAIVQRQPAPGGAPTAPATAAGLATPIAASIRAAAQGGGRPLTGSTRTTMESRFGGHDFSAVRVHADSEANRLAGTLGAEAFTVGRNVFFAAGRYAPGSAPGERLLAHELTHVVQQESAGHTALQTKLDLGSPDTPAEREAERIADAVVRGAAAGPVTRIGAPLVQRQPSLPTPCDAPACATGPDDRNQVCRCPLPNGGERVVLPRTKSLKLPAQKALDNNDFTTNLLQPYLNAASHRALRATHAGRSTNTEGLWGLWARSRPNGDTIMTTTPPGASQTLRQLCSPDHIIELQVGGADNANNLRLLDRARNSAAGSDLNGQLVRARHEYLNAPDSPNSWVEFTHVERGTGGPAADSCLQSDPLLNPRGTVATAAGALRLQYQVGGNSVTTAYLANGQVEPDSRLGVPGMELQTVTPTATPVRLTAGISPEVRRLPLKSTVPPFQLKVEGTPSQLRFDAAPPPVMLTFPFMSDAALTPALENGRWVARGDFTPTLPILRYTQIHLEIRNNDLQGSATVPADRIRQALPIPGLTIDPVTLAIAVVDGQFSATGGVGFRYGNFASGQLTAQLTNAAGFSATGTIDVRIPGIDEARGEAYIRNGRFGARLQIGRNQLRFPGVRSASLVVDVRDGILAGTGTVGLDIPGLSDAQLQFTANSEGQYGLSGAASGRIPGLRDPRLEIIYANGALSGIGRAGFAIPGLESGGLELRYVNGQFSGTATLDYRRGRLTGRVVANLTPAFRLTGHGELGYEIAPGLVAVVGLDLRENGTARVSGELRLPDPIVLFPERGFDRQLFGASIDIPIFGVSFGTRSVGVIANLSAALNARAGIGPGQIRRPRIMAAFDPENEAGAASFQASAELYVPAYAEISVVLRGGVGVSLLIVKALGGISATAAAGLTGALSVPIEIRYAGGQFSIEGAAELFAQPRLRFQLDAFVNVTADLFVTTIEIYSKTWRLAAFEWGSDFRIGLRFPVRYVFGQPFALSVDQVQFIAPQIDTRALLTSLLPQ